MRGCLRWMPLVALAVAATIIGACGSGASNAAMSGRPFPDVEQLVASSDLSIVGRVTSASGVQTVSRRDDPTSRVAYYEASVEVDQLLFGPYYNSVVVRVPVYYVRDNDLIPTKVPLLEPGEVLMLFLTQQDNLFHLGYNDFVVTGGDAVWGKLAVRAGRVTSLHPAADSQPLAEVMAWIEAARFSLAKPGVLAGEVSGLDEGDYATISLLKVGRSKRLEDAVTVTQWTTGNGPWEHEGPRLLEGQYALISEAEGYLPGVRGERFWVPSEGIDWRIRSLGFRFLRSEDASGSGFGQSEGWRPERSVRGWITGLPDRIDAQIRIQHLPRLPRESYAIGPTPSEGSYLPPSLICLEEVDHLEPEETVAVVKASNGKWGLADHALSGKRHLITVEAPGFRTKPAGYVAVLFGGKSPHRVRSVDFHVGGSGPPFCDA